MNNDKFRSLLIKGDVGVAFFYERHNELLRNPIIPMADIDELRIEGADLTAERLMLMPKGQTYVPYLEYGGVEVKTISENQFLPRFGIKDLPCGTLGFPLWGSTEDLPNGWTSYTRESHGNLRRWMEPSEQNRGSRPIILVHLLKTREIDVINNTESHRFFAAIVFEDINGLLIRLHEYLKPYGFDLLNWNTIPVGQKAKKLMVEGLFLQGNMVHIPLSEIADLATVTMIGHDPEVFRTGKCSTSVQHKRLAYLKKLAGERKIPQIKPNDEKQSDDDLYKLWHHKLLFGSVHYPNLGNGDDMMIRF